MSLMRMYGVNGEALKLHVFCKKPYSLLQVTNSVVCSTVALDLIQAVAYSVICLGAVSLLGMQYTVESGYQTHIVV